MFADFAGTCRRTPRAPSDWWGCRFDSRRCTSKAAAGSAPWVSISFVAVTYSLSDLLTFFAVGLHHEAVREQGVERRLTGRAEAAEHRKLEPAAVLVGPFEVEVGRPAQVRVVAEDAPPTAAALEPDVEDVALLAEVAVEAGGAVEVAEQLPRLIGKPGIAAAFGEALADRAHALRRQQRLAAVVVEHRDRQAPRALPADAPVGAVLQHRTQPLLAPLRVERDFIKRGERPLPQRQRFAVDLVRLVERDEPLLGGAEDDRRFAAPVVRVAVRVIGFLEEHAEFVELLGDDVVGFPDGEAGQPVRDGGVEAAVRLDGAVDVEADLPAELVVLVAVAGCGVDEAGAVLGRDVIRGPDLPDPLDERVPVFEADEVLARHRFQHLVRLVREHLADKVRRHDGDAVPELHHRVSHPPAPPRPRGSPAMSTASSSRSSATPTPAHAGRTSTSPAPDWRTRTRRTPTGRCGRRTPIPPSASAV